ncbi:MAG: glucose-6-phosphate isomerase [Clostridia bacterium]|nr:glucose-6-phosphate isomerase [Clostridia bacterium]
MKKDIKLNLKYAGIPANEISAYADQVKKAHKELNKGLNDDTKFTGWIEWPINYDKTEFEKIKKIASKVRTDSDVLIVIGIGGSYLGARSVIESLTNQFERKGTEIIYVGNNLNPNYINEIIEYVSDKDISLNVISKSGKTTEPAIAFRIFRNLMEDKYGVDEARKRIFVTTTKRKGALYKIALQEKYVKLNIPENIGGRYSVLTAVGILPIAVAGLNIDKLMEGAREAAEEYNNDDLRNNDCYKYAVVRNILYGNEKNIEILASYEPKLFYLAEWWKQLYGESEGKDFKGIFPASVTYTTDLHSLGQYVQDGRRNLFETVLNVEKSETDIVIGYDNENLDELNYIAGKNLSFVNQKAMEATITAHVDGDVPNIVIDIDSLNEKAIGHLIYFFEKACAMSGMLLGVNPFNQPGVEKYKNNMYELLGKNKIGEFM